ncbi:hypothetical protein [Amycolatopsis thermophila]|uniref:3-methyladenine DNA glycosylase AlkD n=1 Tax=Amycolatopsis thermophila TaxID=206084 RepID=A0ABU0ETF0_9PSEU|nr:hypothetical protein [Amycolatopsis thermophila]MDQ0378589.1 3-methyladenine DNA glycosylase AlkD [Amycolatopsis thermophila]
MKATHVGDVAQAWTVVVTVPTGETVAAGNWPDLIEARTWARETNRSRVARVRAVVALVAAQRLTSELERGVWG